jgi:hypothetical protein
MKETNFPFTETTKQVTVVRDHILSGLELTVEDLGDSLYDLDKRIRSFDINTGSKYKGAHRVYDKFRAKLLRKKEEKVFEVLPSVLDKRFKKLKTEAPEPKKKAKQEEIDPSVDKARRAPNHFAEKSKQAQYAAAKQVRYTHEAPAILLAAPQSQSLAGKKDASFVMRKTGSKTGLTAAKARATIVKPPEKKMTKLHLRKVWHFCSTTIFPEDSTELK